jgi:hypothetical protein
VGEGVNMIKKSSNPYETYNEATKEEMLQVLKESPFPYITEKYFNNDNIDLDTLKEMLFIDPRIINNIMPLGISRSTLVDQLTEEEILRLIEKEGEIIRYIPDNLRKSEEFLREAYKRNKYVYDVLVDMKRDSDRQDEWAWQNTVDWYSGNENEAGFHFTSCWDFCIWPEDLL